ncbi:MAG: helix-turn-helix domain-containing protein [Acidimicrobiales bacterium]
MSETPDGGRSAGGPDSAIVAGAGGSPSLRVDAERNRERILAAAQEVFAEWGLNAAMEKIARRAGVGIATLYRRFPTRANLIAASFERKMADFAAAAAYALDGPDAWTGFTWLINKVCAMQAADAGLKDILSMRFPASSSAEALRSRAMKDLEQLIGRAQRQGALRSDFVAADVPMLLFANAGVVTATRDNAPDMWRRFTAYMIDALRAEHAR